MKNSLILLTIIFSTISLAKNTFDLKIELYMYGEYSTAEEIKEDAIKKNWQVLGEDKFLLVKKNISVEDLPMSLSLDDFSVSITAESNGLMKASMGASYGDLYQLRKIISAF